jgi:hypothetical protein
LAPQERSIIFITDTSDVALCTAITDPGSNTLSFTGCTIPVTTTVTTFKVRITPKTHAGMPAVPGASYAVTGTVTAFTSTNTQAGTDSGSATVTVDNLSPDNVTGAGVTPGDTQATVSWANPGLDFSNVLVLRNTATIGDVPTEGSTPAVDDPIGSSVVRYTISGTSFVDTGLTNGTQYFYRIFAKDIYGNYAATGIEVSTTPSSGFTMTTGSYTGNGTGQSITGLGFQPSLDPDGFTVGSRVQINQSGVENHWVAFKAAPGSLHLGSYTGSGVGQTISGVGFQPDWVMTLPASAGRSATQKTASLPVANSTYMSSGLIWNYMTGFTAPTRETAWTIGASRWASPRSTWS